MSRRGRLVAALAVLSVSGALGVFSIAQAQDIGGEVGCDTEVTTGPEPASGGCGASVTAEETRIVTKAVTVEQTAEFTATLAPGGNR